MFKIMETLNGMLITLFFFSVQTSKMKGLREIGDRKSIASTVEVFLPMIVSTAALI